MGRVNTPTLTPSQRKELEIGFRDGNSHCFRMRCQSVLLKSTGRTSKDVGSITGVFDVRLVLTLGASDIKPKAYWD